MTKVQRWNEVLAIPHTVQDEPGGEYRMVLDDMEVEVVLGSKFVRQLAERAYRNKSQKTKALRGAVKVRIIRTLVVLVLATLLAGCASAPRPTAVLKVSTEVDGVEVTGEVQFRDRY